MSDATAGMEGVTQADLRVELRCPHCGNTEVGESDVILGTAEGGWAIVNGERAFEPGGYTEVHWDSQEPVKDRDGLAFCRACANGWSPEQLLTPDQWEAKQERGDA